MKEGWENNRIGMEGAVEEGWNRDGRTVGRCMED